MPIPPAPTIDPTPPAALLTVTSDPAGAMVSLDGIERGITPVTLTGLSNGLHKLTVTMSGYQDYSTWVRITIGKTATVHATLKVKGGPTTVPTTVPTTTPTQTPSSDETGSLTVTSTPTGARVSLDGTYKGKTPFTISGISVGIHHLEVSKSGYLRYYTPVGIQKGKTQNIHVTLMRALKSVRL